MGRLSGVRGGGGLGGLGGGFTGGWEITGVYVMLVTSSWDAVSREGVLTSLMLHGEGGLYLHDLLSRRLKPQEGEVHDVIVQSSVRQNVRQT